MTQNDHIIPESTTTVETVFKKRILLVDDHAVVREGLSSLINQQHDLSVCGGAADAQQGLGELDRLKPDAVLVDISLPGMNGLEFIKNAKALYPTLPIVVLSMHDESLYAKRSLRAGALGYVMKKAGGQEVITALRDALEGKLHLSESTVAEMLKLPVGKDSDGGSPLSKLSDRELEVFEMMGRGKTTRELADALHLSTKTIDAHRMHIKKKLNLHSAAEVMQHAVRYVEHELTP
jgi:DNA-binding NarL/FixJ family response regulator